MNRITYLLPVFLFLFSGCGAGEDFVVSDSDKNCTATTQSIIAELPVGSVELKLVSPFTSPDEAISVRSLGAYVGKNTLLTIAHALPPTARISGMSEIKRDEDGHLLLLRTDICGKPLVLASAQVQSGTEVYDCEGGALIGKITGFEDHTYSSSPLSSVAVLLKGLAVLPGSYTAGDSGRPFCDRQGFLVGILAAVREASALLIPAEQIRPFLN